MRRTNIIGISFFFFLALIIVSAYFGYNAIFGSNIRLKETSKIEVFVSERSNIISLANDSTLFSNALNCKRTLLLTSRLKRFKGDIKPGLYVIHHNMSNNDIINIFRSGIQKPISLTFNNIRTKEQLAGVLGQQLMSDSLEILSTLTNTAFINEKGFNQFTAVCPFLPDTYEVYWTISPKELYNRMVKEYEQFWDTERLKKAKKISLSQNEIVTLASIVNEESNLKIEQPIIAGLYLNRIKRGYLLQADPTLKFAIGNFAKKRIINDDKLIDSPYNTYKYKGLPPGPIRIPTKDAIDAVLNYKQHSYLYMCAKADFSGEHHFSETLREHLNYAKEYQRTLNKLRIYK